MDPGIDVMDSPQQSLYLIQDELDLQGEGSLRQLASWGQKEPWNTPAHSTDRNLTSRDRVCLF